MFELCSRAELYGEEINRFRMLVSDLEDLNGIEDSSGLNPLLFLCHYSQSSRLCCLVKTLLLTKKIDVNKKGRDGSNALTVACRRHVGSGLLEIVELLIDQGIEVNHTNALGENAIFALGCNQNIRHDVSLLEIVTALIDARIDVNAQHISGFNVMYPLIKNHCDHPDFAKTARFLVSKGVSVNIINVTGKHCFIAILESLVGSIKDDSLTRIIQIFIICKVNLSVKNDALKILLDRGYDEYSQVISLLNNYV